MQTFIAAFILLLLVVLAMAIGYILKRRTLSGSCGGMANLGIEKVCDCDTPCARRRAEMERRQRPEDDGDSNE